MPVPSSLHEYMALCCAPHNLRYVARSVMLSCFTDARSFLAMRVFMAT